MVKLAADIPAPLKAAYYNAISRVVRMRYEELPQDVADNAQNLIDKGHFEAAQATVRSCPAWEGSYLGNLLLGNSFFRMEQLDEAESEWLIADGLRELVNAQRASVIRTNRAMRLIMSKEYTKAVELCDAAIAWFPNWAGPWVNKLSALNFAARQPSDGFAQRQAEFAESVFAEMDRLWPEWRADPEMAKSLANDPHLVGVKRYIPPPAAAATAAG
jgi:hypothetical protein